MFSLTPTARRSRGLVVVLLAAWVAALSGCGPAEESQVVGATSAPPRILPLVPSTTEPAAGQATGRSTAASFVLTGDGVALPDTSLTPGAVFGDVDAAAICDAHYTQGVRQPHYNAKVDAFANYGVSIHDRELYQVDHLVPIALGGSNAEGNLWPQPYDPRAGAEQKDLLERQLRGLVCSQKLALGDAQQAIKTDWWDAYQRFMGQEIVPGSDGPEPPTRAAPKPGEVVNGGVCDVAGAAGYTEPKRIKLTCTLTSSGELQWQKRL